jgi:hypothetical protein
LAALKDPGGPDDALDPTFLMVAVHEAGHALAALARRQPDVEVRMGTGQSLILELRLQAVKLRLANPGFLKVGSGQVRWNAERTTILDLLINRGRRARRVAARRAGVPVARRSVPVVQPVPRLLRADRRVDVRLRRLPEPGPAHAHRGVSQSGPALRCGRTAGSSSTCCG